MTALTPSDPKEGVEVRAIPVSQDRSAPLRAEPRAASQARRAAAIANRRRKSDRLGIVRDEGDPYDRGYWARFDGLPRPADPAEAKGWDECANELKLEASDRRLAKREKLREAATLARRQGGDLS